MTREAEGRLRADFFGKRGKSDKSEAEWQYLVDQQWVEEALEQPSGKRMDILHKGLMAREKLPVETSARPTRTRTSRRGQSCLLTPYETARRTAFEEALAEFVGAYDVEARRFAREVIKTKMTLEEADAFRASDDPAVAELSRISARLVTEYPWAQDQADRFLLTHVPPAVAPLKVSAEIRVGTYYTRGTIAITAEPWVSAETVQATYRYVQDAMLKGDGRTGGPRRMQIGPAIVSFVLKQGRASWREMWEHWNADPANRDRQYGATKTFKQAYRRALLAILRPRYELPEKP